MTQIKAPHKLLLLGEGRSLFEFGAGVATLPLVKKIAPQGDGQPVLVLPGLGANDLSTKLLRVFLEDMGYAPYGWNLGINRGMQGNVLGTIVSQVKTIHETHNRKVSVIGQSMGGIFARETAKAIPDMIRQVITLGSPFTGDIEATNAKLAYQILSGETITEKDRTFFESVKNKPSVPVTSVYSKLDGVVSWECSIEESTDMAENIELLGSTHIGMASSPTALYLIAHRLAEKEGMWQAFKPNLLMSAFYR